MREDLQSVINQIVEKHQFSGSIAIFKSHEILETSSGYANRVEQQLNNVTTRFGIASGCKLFTAIAIAQLVENERLSFKPIHRVFRTILMRMSWKTLKIFGSRRQCIY